MTEGSVQRRAEKKRKDTSAEKVPCLRHCQTAAIARHRTCFTNERSGSQDQRTCLERLRAVSSQTAGTR